MMKLFALIFILVIGTITYQLKIYFFFYTHQSILTMLNRFLNGRALEIHEYHHLHLIPRTYLFKQIQQNFFNIQWNAESIAFLQHSGFFPYYLNQKNIHPDIIPRLWEFSPAFLNCFIEALYPLFSLKSQLNLILSLIAKNQDLSLQMLYIFISRHPGHPVAAKLIRQLDPAFIISWFEKKMNRSDFSYVFFAMLPVFQPENIISHLENLIPKFSVNEKILLMDCINFSKNLNWLPILNILEDDIPLVRSKSMTTRKELITYAQNCSYRPGLQRREDPCHHFEQLITYLFV